MVRRNANPFKQNRELKCSCAEICLLVLLVMDLLRLWFDVELFLCCVELPSLPTGPP
jgi:hypothetical protein